MLISINIVLNRVLEVKNRAYIGYYIALPILPIHKMIDYEGKHKPAGMVCIFAVLYCLRLRGNAVPTGATGATGAAGA